jgi:hypothetical protein
MGQISHTASDSVKIVVPSSPFLKVLCIFAKLEIYFKGDFLYIFIYNYDKQYKHTSF